MNFLSTRTFPYLLLTLLMACYILPGLIQLPIVDRDEPRFAQASLQMIESGNYVDIRFQDRARYKKPVGIYWLQSASAQVIGQVREIWPYRLPSFVGSVVAVWCCYAVGMQLFGSPTAALIGAVVFGLNPMLLLQGLAARADGALVGTIAVTQYFLARAYLGTLNRRWQAYAFWIAMAASVLLKGPIGLLIAAFTAITLGIWERRWQWLSALRPLSGVVLMSALVLPWLIAIQIHSDGAFLQKSFGEDLMQKVYSGVESHGAPPGYYLLLTLALYPPLLLALAPVVSTVWNTHDMQGVRFCLAWLIPTWLLFELIPTKLPHYVLPMLPAVSLLMGFTVQRIEGRGLIGRVLEVIALLGMVALAASPIVLPKLVGTEISIPVVAISTIALILFFWGWRAVCDSRWSTGISICTYACAIEFLLLTGFVFPSLHPIWMTERAKERVEAVVGVGHIQPNPSIAFVGYSEPSAVFRFGTKTSISGSENAVNMLKNTPNSLVLVATQNLNELEAFVSTAADADIQVQQIDEFEGFNYSKGKWMRVFLLTR